MQKFSLLFLLLVFASSFSWSQDKIYRKNGKVVEAKVLEIGNSEVKYREFRNPDGPIYVLETDRISKIEYENGKVEKFTDDLKDPERYEGQLNKAIKFDFFGPLLGYTQLSFEKSTGVGKGYEISVGIIGAGKSSRLEYYDANNTWQTVKRGQLGAFASFGYKFGKLPDFILFGKTRLTHIMQGTYIKPILYLGHYKENQVQWKGNNNYELGEQNVTFGALQLEAGKQWVFGDKVLLDMYFGMGYGVDDKKDSYEYSYDDPYDNTAAYNYANARVGASPGLSFSFGVKLGLLIK
ncbi:MAG TPA: hypothetical protein VIZ28_02515 [Chitinophagaceae bacterium]